MPSPLYKYSELRWARALVSEGSIKIGTLSEYRSKEGHDQERGDGHEGELTLQSRAGRHVYGGKKLPPPLQIQTFTLDQVRWLWKGSVLLLFTPESPISLFIALVRLMTLISVVDSPTASQWVAFK